MAESMFVHFATATWDDITPWLDQRASRFGHRQWHYPQPDYTLLVYEYPDLQAEYAQEDVEQLRGLLGRQPSLSLCLELRRSRGDRACDAAVALSRALLQAFPGLADDGMAKNNYWSLAKLEAEPLQGHGQFLDCYRVGQ